MTDGRHRSVSHSMSHPHGARALVLRGPAYSYLQRRRRDTLARAAPPVAQRRTIESPSEQRRHAVTGATPSAEGTVRSLMRNHRRRGEIESHGDRRSNDQPDGDETRDHHGTQSAATLHRRPSSNAPRSPR